MPEWLQITVGVARAFDGFLTPVLIAIGGIFAYYKFFRQGQHEVRLQPSIAGSLALSGGIIYLRVETAAQNLGNVPALLSYEAPSLRILYRQAGDETWSRYDTRGVLVDEDIIRPTETVTDYVWLEIPVDNAVALRLEMDVFVSEEQETEIYSWMAAEVVNLVAQRNNAEYTDGE